MAGRESVRIGTMTLKISKEQKQACRFYDLLFGLCDELLPGCGCDVVLLPERSALKPEDRQPVTGPHFQRFAALAKKHKLFLMAPLAEQADGTCYNTHAVIAPTGELVHAYRKVHLAPFEEQTASPGKSFAAFDLPWFRAGLLICFDNHFPEPSRLLALDGAKVLFWPAFGNVARATVDATRCIDNHVYVVASGIIDMACDLPAAMFTRGAVFNPDGEVLAQTGADNGLAVVELPLESGKLKPWPADPNYLTRRRPASYAAIAAKA